MLAFNVCISHQSYRNILTNDANGIRGLCTKYDINQTFWTIFDKCNGLWPSREPR